MVSFIGEYRYYTVITIKLITFRIHFSDLRLLSLINLHIEDNKLDKFVEALLNKELNEFLKDNDNVDSIDIEEYYKVFISNIIFYNCITIITILLTILLFKI